MRHRNLLNVGGSSVRPNTLGHRTYTRALTQCVSSTSGVMGGRQATRANRAPLDQPATVLEHVRTRELRAGITDYIGIALRVGLDAKNVAKLYRQRADNGYTAHVATATLTTNDLAERRI